MARLTFTEASRVTRTARSTLYRAVQEGRLTREPNGTIDTAELLRAGFTLHTETSATPVHGDSPLRDATSSSEEKDTVALRSLERLVATLERELEAAKAREAELLAILRSQQETHQRLLEQGQSSGFWNKLLDAWLRPKFPPP